MMDDGIRPVRCYSTGRVAVVLWERTITIRRNGPALKRGRGRRRIFGGELNRSFGPLVFATMDDLIDDIEFAVEHGRWLLALAGALALPDICAAIQSENGQTTGSKYKNWVRGHLAEKYPSFDPEEMYKMRCSFLHQGTSSTLKYNRVIFCPPELPISIHNSVMSGFTPDGGDSVLMLDLPTFCSDVIDAVNAWRSQFEGTANYRRNIEKIMRWHPNGVEPYIIGGRVLT
ncbi:hypothetical protein QEO74_gp35 [Arthrobacter phage Nandita]|uniref:Uncharacterized protein n=8 Tax=Caudoviricetes TaxID=2731619 RepID=A0A3G2KI42_9CAUD|nr:hypothetical protein QEO74_gp35 [Arthrobacter phage Nandita]AYN58656.1 hypothetical protein PBI_NANDITA_35 [Arthrobacter phage Nandita]